MNQGPASVTELSQRPVMASFLGAHRMHRRPVAAGGGVAIGAGILTWFFIVWLIGRFHAGEFDVQAATRLPSLIVLLTVMNWFFHKTYWTGWISHHRKRRRSLLSADAETIQSARSSAWRSWDSLRLSQVL